MAAHFFVARYFGHCTACGAVVRPGDTVAREAPDRIFHRACYAKTPCTECGRLGPHSTWCTTGDGPGAAAWNRWSLVEKVEFMVKQRRVAR